MSRSRHELRQAVRNCSAMERDFHDQRGHMEKTPQRNRRVTIEDLSAAMEPVLDELQVEDDALYRRAILIIAARLGGLSVDVISSFLRMRSVDILSEFDRYRPAGHEASLNSEIAVATRMAWVRARKATAK
jgi:hypothetical protein